MAMRERFEFMACELGRRKDLGLQCKVLDAYGLNGWSLGTLKEWNDGTVVAYLQRPLISSPADQPDEEPVEKR